MTSASFRDSMNSLGWSRRDADVPANTSRSPFLSRLQSLNPFSGEGYVSLPTQEGPGAPLPAPTRREEEEGYLTRKFTSCDEICSCVPFCHIHGSCRWSVLADVLVLLDDPLQAPVPFFNGSLLFLPSASLNAPWSQISQKCGHPV